MHVIRKCIGQSVMNADMQRRRGKKPTISLCGISQRARRFVSLTTSSRQTMKLRTKEWKEVESTEIYGRKSFSWQRSITSYGNPEISTLHSKYTSLQKKEKKENSLLTCQSRREIVQYGRKQAWNVSRIQNHCMANHLWAEDFRPFFFVGHKAKVRTNLTLASHNFELKWSWYDLVLLPQPGCGSKVLFVPLQFLCEKRAQLYFCTCTGFSLNYEPVK